MALADLSATGWAVFSASGTAATPTFRTRRFHRSGRFPRMKDEKSVTIPIFSGLKRSLPGYAPFRGA